MTLNELRNNDMMAHLIDALDAGRDIGHYGRLVFAMIGRHFLDERELCDWLCKDPTCTDVQAKALVQQVNDRNYNPPRRERILQWQREQQFPICPNGTDPDAYNVYRNL